MNSLHTTQTYIMFFSELLSRTFVYISQNMTSDEKSCKIVEKDNDDSNDNDGDDDSDDENDNNNSDDDDDEILDVRLRQQPERKAALLHLEAVTSKQEMSCRRR